ncbi:MAG: Hpt domain-containing protein [Lachnospiraceae bacterium]|nr:Hpt domain-containing protein [Lachnospiraceae bacterium]
MLSVEALEEYGANTKEAIARCANKEDLYLKLVKRIPTDKGFDRLKDALDAGNLDEAFEAAHGLKGIVANLSLTPLLTPISDITEKTRAKEEADYGPLLNEMFLQRDKLSILCDD